MSFSIFILYFLYLFFYVCFFIFVLLFSYLFNLSKLSLKKSLIEWLYNIDVKVL